MNARLYDPVLGRFLSPDPYVSDSFFSQSYNRYSYVGNRPLFYTDPSGMNPHKGNTDPDEDGTYHIKEVVITPKNNNNTNLYIAPIWFGWGSPLPQLSGSGNYYSGPGNSYDSGGGGAPKVITGLNNVNQYISVTTSIVGPAASAGIKESKALIDAGIKGAKLASETQALTALRWVQGVARVGNVAGVAIGTGIAGVHIYQGTATTIDYIDAIGGGSALLAAGGAFLLGSNPVGWAILGGAGIWFTGRMVYDWLY